MHFFQLRTAVVVGLCMLRLPRRGMAFSTQADVHVSDSIGGGDGLILTAKATANKQASINSVVIWLHGLGDTAEGWFEPISVILDKHPNTRFILPTASHRSITLNNGYRMPAWFDLASLPDSRGSRLKEDEEGLEASAQRVLRIIDQQVAQARVLAGVRVSY